MNSKERESQDQTLKVAKNNSIIKSKKSKEEGDQLTTGSDLSYFKLREMGKEWLSLTKVGRS